MAWANVGAAAVSTIGSSLLSGGGNSSAGQPSSAQDALTAQQTANAKQSAANSQQLFDQYTKNYVPVQNQTITDAMNLGSTQDQTQKAGVAGAQVKSSFAGAQDANQRSMNRMGVNPGSGDAIALKQDANLQEAGQESGAMNNARTQAIAQGIAARQQVANEGAGLVGASTNLANSATSATGSALGAADAQQTQYLNTQQQQNDIAAKNAQGMGTLVGQAVGQGITNYNSPPPVSYPVTQQVNLGSTPVYQNLAP